MNHILVMVSNLHEKEVFWTREQEKYKKIQIQTLSWMESPSLIKTISKITSKSYCFNPEDSFSKMKNQGQTNLHTL